MKHLWAMAGLMASLALAPSAASAQHKVVYHVDNASAQGLKGLRSIRNHLDTDPKAKVTVVALAEGIDFLLEGAKDAQGNPYIGPIAALAARGVRFEVCDLTLRSRNLKRESFIQEADFTPSGVVRITQLQSDGHAYIKP
ncbi:MAG: DsrE family protein [Rubrivivax sp.]|jgi:hypothetical protein|nr:DsrE family protein [Rubrivivax sp.]